MNSTLRCLALSMLLAAIAIIPRTSEAQGVCRCNMGCHARPGQCVIAVESACGAGYAPFCGTRTASCPMMGWVSCDGTCSCVPIPGWDGGTADVVGVDTVGTDVVGMDTVRPDVAGTDVVGADIVTTDSPGTDVIPGADTLVLDAAECPDGVVIEGMCFRERCVWHGTEIGWACATPRTGCRIIAGTPYCIPRCLGVTCAAGEFCDPDDGCTADRCATISCDAGTTCRMNRCVDPSAGADGSAAGDGGDLDGGVGGDGAAGDGGNTGRRGGCACRTPQHSSSRSGAALLALLLGTIGCSRRRYARRRRAAEGPNDSRELAAAFKPRGGI